MFRILKDNKNIQDILKKILLDRFDINKKLIKIIAYEKLINTSAHAKYVENFFCL